VNPFDTEISFELVSPENGTAVISLRDTYGRIVRSVKEPVNAGVNSMQVKNLANLTPGIYVVQIQLRDKIVTRRLIKGEKL
jgi:hypothetical protein